MSRSSDPQTLGVWRSRFQRFSSSGLPVGRFCVGERVSVASFYYWRKKLGPGSIVRAVGLRRGALDESRSDRAGMFQPVTVVPAASGVWIRLPGGTEIEVRGEHPDAVRAVIAEVARFDGGVPVRGVDGSPEAERSPSCRRRGY